MRAGRDGAGLAAPLGSAAVDNAEPADPGLGRSLAAPPGEQPHRRADPAGEEEARAERGAGDDGQLATGACRFTSVASPSAARSVVDGLGELLALRLDVAADLLARAAVTGHRS